MEKQDFMQYLDAHGEVIAEIQALAHKIHADVNQHYDRTLPYAVHLDSVAEFVMQYAHEICDDPRDIVPILFGAYFHDSIEDARLTYNNVLKIASSMMDADQALLAAEIVYALTNEKGRTRAERANDKYYAGIRAVPYAAMCKFADRLANVSYSMACDSSYNAQMHGTYAAEMPHFVESLTCGTPDLRHSVPADMQAALLDLVNTKK